VALEPDLVLAFSDLQAGIVQDLARAGLAVRLFNQRDVAGILAMIRTLGALIDRRDAANTLADSLARRLKAIAREQQH
jgi:iron complex transport system substrate-binding protein